MLNSEMKPRVLVVDDDLDLLTSFKKWIERAGFEVDCASSKEKAFQRISERIYHAALIDIMLSDDHADRSGIVIADRLQSNGDGTALVILSGSSNLDVPIAFIDKQISKYIQKQRILDPSDYVDPIKQAVNNAKIQYYAGYEDLDAYLAGPSSVEMWEAGLLDHLGGETQIIEVIDLFAKLRANTMENLTPLVKSVEHVRAFSIDPADKGHVSDIFWSRRNGEAYEVHFFVEGSPFAENEHRLLKNDEGTVAMNSIGMFTSMVLQCKSHVRSDFDAMLR